MDPEWIHVVISMVTLVVVPMAAYYVKSEIAKSHNTIRLQISGELGDRKVHERESEIRHQATAARVTFLENQWQAIQARMDQQQNLLREWSPRDTHGD